ncbi:unnamed protein product [Orchesella dallaii]|uniref:AMP-dependent synthetase/ligase domain-containing protein n=1 Tax=Orchesella dallaii TaxID=48710 RepID=A0ABP1PMD7_9HEXA
MSIGKLVPDSVAKFIDSDRGEAVRPGEMGELCIKSNGLLTSYYLNPEASEKAFDEDGFFKTGDVGKMLVQK